MTKPYQGFKLLAVDDNPDNLFTLRALISQHMGVEILDAGGGAEALEIAQSQPDIAKIRNICAATPACERIPTPIIEIFVTFASV